MLTIKHIMTKTYPILNSDSRVIDAEIYFLEKKLQPIPVVNGQNKLVGLLSAPNFLTALKNGIDKNSPIKEIMSTDFQIIQESEPINKLISYQNKIIVVTNEAGCIAGVIPKSKPAMINQTLDPHLKSIFNSFHNKDGILIIDGTAKLIFCNALAARIMGFDPDGSLGHWIQEIFNDALLMKMLETFHPEEGGLYEVDNRIFRAGYSPIIQEGDVVGAFTVFQDLTDQQKLEKELARINDLNKELNAIIEYSYDGIAVTDSKGKLLRMSKSYCRITGICWDKLQQFEGEYVGDVTKSPKLYKSGTINDSLLVLVNNQSTTIKEMLWNKKELIMTGNPVLNVDGTIDRVVWNIRDVTATNELKDLSARYFTELEDLRARQVTTNDHHVIYKSPAMKNVLELVARVAIVDATVLITGETGVGKEIIAKLIQKSSPRRKGPFISVNCGAIPEALMESELFGYESGSFTGATRGGKIGLLETANTGTLFLDEIADLPMPLQVKLLRFIQEQQIIRVGGTRQIKLDVRILAATNKDLKLMVKQNKFREDLFYRLSVVPVNIPPLRDRKLDIVPLTKFLFDKYSNKYNIKKNISSDAFYLLEQYSWPGNVRELENLIERALISCDDPTILPKHIQNYLGADGETLQSSIEVRDLLSLKNAKEKLEKDILNQARNSGLSTREIANKLHVDHSTIVRKLNKYKIVTTIPSLKETGTD